MIAADTSVLSAFLKGGSGKDIDQLVHALQSGNLRLPPVVLTEILSDPAAADDIEDIITQIEQLEISEGYWQRAGRARKVVKTKGFKAKVADALIAQSCIDHNVALLTRDNDFRHFARHCGLKLAGLDVT